MTRTLSQAIHDNQDFYLQDLMTMKFIPYELIWVLFQNLKFFQDMHWTIIREGNQCMENSYLDSLLRLSSGVSDEQWDMLSVYIVSLLGNTPFTFEVLIKQFQVHFQLEKSNEKRLIRLIMLMQKVSYSSTDVICLKMFKVGCCLITQTEYFSSNQMFFGLVENGRNFLEEEYIINEADSLLELRFLLTIVGQSNISRKLNEQFVSKFLLHLLKITRNINHLHTLTITAFFTLHEVFPKKLRDELIPMIESQFDCCQKGKFEAIRSLPIIIKLINRFKEIGAGWELAEKLLDSLVYDRKWIEVQGEMVVKSEKSRYPIELQDTIFSSILDSNCRLKILFIELIFRLLIDLQLEQRVVYSKAVKQYFSEVTDSSLKTQIELLSKVHFRSVPTSIDTNRNQVRNWLLNTLNLVRFIDSETSLRTILSFCEILMKQESTFQKEIVGLLCEIMKEVYSIEKWSFFSQILPNCKFVRQTNENMIFQTIVTNLPKQENKITTFCLDRASKTKNQILWEYCIELLINSVEDMQSFEIALSNISAIRSIQFQTQTIKSFKIQFSRFSSMISKLDQIKRPQKI